MVRISPKSKTMFPFRSALFIVLITFITYLPALKNGFVNWDDNLYVYENLDIQALNVGFLKWSLSAIVGGLWHPLTLISLAIDHAFWGLNPSGYHLTNIIFHSLNTLIVFILARKLFSLGHYQNDSTLPAAVASLLVGLHPLRVESVVWISERKDVLSTFFYLLTLLTYLKYASEKTKKTVPYIACISFYISALMSKPMAISLPIVLLILDYYPLKRIGNVMNNKRLLIEKIPFFVASMITVLITLWVPSLSNSLKTLDTYPFLGRIFIAIHSYVFYLIKIMMPIGLSPLYLYPARVNPFDIAYLTSFVLFSLITIFCIRSKKKDKLFLSVWLFYLITLLPVIGIIQVGKQAAANRYTYLPTLGLSIVAGLGIHILFEKVPKKKYKIVCAASLIIYIGILVGTTIRQTAIWQDSISLWTQEIKLYPTFADAYLSRGLAYSDMGYEQQAIIDLTKAINLNSSRIGYIYYMRGSLYKKSGDYQKAISDFSSVIDINPNSKYAYADRGYTFNTLGNYEKAIIDFSKVIEIDHQDAYAYNNRGSAYSWLGDHRMAIIDFTKSIEINPHDARVYNSRGIAYGALGNQEQAIKDFSKAIEFNPNYAETYFNRGLIYRKSGSREAAINDFNKAIELNPYHAGTYYNLWLIYSKEGKTEQGLIYYKRFKDLTKGSL